MPQPASAPESGSESPTRASTPSRAPGGRRGRLLAAAGALLAVAALIAVAAVWLPDRGGAKNPGSTPGTGSAHVAPAAQGGADPFPPITAGGDRRAAWTALPHDDGIRADVLAGWLTPAVVVRVDTTGVRGFDPRTGAARWTVDPPSDGLVPCGASDGATATSGGVGLIRFGKPYTSPALCDTAAALDTATGRLLWHRRIGESRLNLASVSGDVLVVSGEEGILGLRRTTGETVWTYRWTQGDCKAGYVLPGVRTVLVSESCKTADRETDRVSELDAGRGTARVVDSTEQSGWIELLQADPVVTAHMDSASATLHPSKIRFVRPDGQPPVDVPAEQPFGRVAGKHTAAEGVWVTMTETMEGEDRIPGLAAFDPTTGRVRWHVRMAADTTDLMILRIQGDSLYTVEGDPVRGQPITHAVRRRSLATGRVTESSGPLPYSYHEGSPTRLAATGGLLVQFNDITAPFLMAAFDTTTG